MNNILYNFLSAYWLRPETALWRTLDVESMKNFQFVSPSLDLGCGDGTFSFLRAGGEFDKTFDVFMSVNHLDKFYKNIDVYDSFNDLEVKIIKKPSYKIDVGVDHKQNLMNKAKKIGLYNEFVLADANNKLPFDNESFQSIFSNIVYWLNNPENVLKEIYRILKHGGKCCLMLPNITYLESSFYYQLFEKEKKEEFKFLELIDRGRIKDNLKVVKTYQEWKKIIEEAGFQIEECVPHLSKTLIQIWDIGLRPIFPMLKRMTERIDTESLMEIKKDWIDLFLELGQPIIDNDVLLTQGQEFCFFCFVITKR